MLIPRELILEAKEKLGEDAAIFINEKMELENWDEKDLKASCPLQSTTDNTPSFIWNSKDNCFHCFSCGKNFGILDYYIEIEKLSFLDACSKLFEQTGISFHFGERGIKTDRDYKYPRHEQFDNRNKVESYLGLRGISKETMNYADIQQDEHGDIVFHYYDLNDVLCVVKYRLSRKFDKKTDKNKMWAQAGADNTRPILYLMNKIDVTKPLLICEGEIDCLSAIEAGYRNSVSVPFGADNTKWIEENWEWLNEFQSIYVWADNDKPGLEMRKEVCSRLGTWRTKFVDLPSKVQKDGKEFQVKDINEALFYLGKESVLEYIENAQDAPVPNVIDLSDADDFDIETAPGLYTGLKSVDDIVYKLIYGSVVILTGQRGSGKSTFLNQTFICEALNQGEDCYVYSGELGAPVLKNWLECTMLNREHIEMKNGFVRKFDPVARQQVRDWYRGRVWMYDDIDNTSKTILDRGVSITRKFGAKIWILDNLTCMDLGSNSEKGQWEKQKDFIVQLVSLAKVYNILIVLVVHPRKLDSMSVERKLMADDVAGAGELTNLCQYGITIHRYSKKEKEGEKNKKGDGYVKGKEPIPYDVLAAIFKNRYTGKMGEAQLYFDYPSYRFYDTVQELFKRYKWDKNTTPIPSKDPNHHEGDAPEGFGED